MTFGIRGQVLMTVCLIGVWTAGCRQADGPVPVPEGESINRIEDMGKNLRNVSSGAEGAFRELADDLAVLNDRTAPARIDALARGLEMSLSGVPLNEDAAHDIATTLFVALAARDWNQRQVEQLTTDLAGQLESAGAARPEAAVAAVEAIMRETATRPARWYERS